MQKNLDDYTPRKQAWKLKPRGGSGVHETLAVTMCHSKYMCNFDRKDVIASAYSQIRT